MPLGLIAVHRFSPKSLEVFKASVDQVQSQALDVLHGHLAFGTVDVLVNFRACSVGVAVADHLVDKAFWFRMFDLAKWTRPLR